MSYNALALIAPDCGITLQDAEIKLVNFFNHDPTKPSMSVSHGENRLTLSFDRWALYIYLDMEPSVLQESQEMANRFGQHHPDKEIIATCNSRLEISSDTDENMDHFNDYVLSIEQLGKIPGIFVLEMAGLEFI
ncbi:hypothetical protein IQ244_16295 [Nostoc sp. LEGE 06077]|uniref:hypothetical protein n=1 Tax=Nostoc sp. LEGE 06077 TaxID=915325 RepID=UPI001880BE7D|nr:hypothetical protein [Nostoc sp. LEGE 06077]MBE9208056.1 hypothetical protein [Nostoc sp. LEGE 06077]